MFKDYVEDFKLLVEAGFSALYKGNFIGAEQMFKAAMVLKPKHTAPLLGLSHVTVHQFRLDEALEYSQKVLKLDPEEYLAQSIFGLALLLKKQNVDQGVAMIEKALEMSKDPTVTNLCKSALEWYQKQPTSSIANQ